MNKEAVIGSILLILIVGLIGYSSGLSGIVYIGLSVMVGLLALFLYSLKSKAAKLGAFMLFPELLTKLLMPKSTKKALE